MSETIQDDIRRGNVDPQSNHVAKILHKWNPHSFRKAKQSNDGNEDLSTVGSGTDSNSREPETLRTRILKEARMGQCEAAGDDAIQPPRGPDYSERLRLRGFTYLNGASPVIRLRKSESICSYSTDEPITLRRWKRPWGMPRPRFETRVEATQTVFPAVPKSEEKLPPITIVHSVVDDGVFTTSLDIGGAIGDSSSDFGVGVSDTSEPEPDDVEAEEIEDADESERGSFEDYDLSEWYYDVDDSVTGTDGTDTASIYSYCSNANTESNSPAQAMRLPPPPEVNPSVHLWLYRGSPDSYAKYRDGNRNICKEVAATSRDSVCEEVAPPCRQNGSGLRSRLASRLHLELPARERHSEDEDSVFGTRLLNSPPHIRDIMQLIRGNHGVRTTSDDASM